MYVQYVTVCMHLHVLKGHSKMESCSGTPLFLTHLGQLHPELKEVSSFQGSFCTHLYRCSWDHRYIECPDFKRDPGDVLISEVSLPVFSPAYLRRVGPTSVQYKIPFDDVGIGIIQKLCCGYRLLPHHALLSCLEFCLGS